MKKLCFKKTDNITKQSSTTVGRRWKQGDQVNQFDD